jgi:hypothetical protein
MTALADLLPGDQAAALQQLRVQLRRAELARLNAPRPRRQMPEKVEEITLVVPTLCTPAPAVFRAPERSTIAEHPDASRGGRPVPRARV